MVFPFLFQEEPKAAPSTDRPLIGAQRPVELGAVDWRRDLAAAQLAAAKTDKPILVLFQEVPGCQTCQNFGNAPLSHPLLVETIEDLFIPVLVYNNKPEDEKTLTRFGEPSWNNPVIRYFDADAQDLIERKENIWSTEATARRMIEALKAAGRQIPGYLPLIANVSSKSKTETAEFAMHCYWEGEAKLSSIEGVREARSGWRDNLEVVQVEFDPQVVDYKKLLSTAQSFECATKVFTHNERQQSVAESVVGKDAVAVTGKMKTAQLSDRKYYVRNSDFSHLALTSLQATKINAALYRGKSPREWLSPRQLKMLESIISAKRKNKNAFSAFVWPDDDSKLAKFHGQLFAAIASNTKRETRIERLDKSERDSFRPRTPAKTRDGSDR